MAKRETMEMADLEGGGLGSGPYGELVGEEGVGEERVQTPWGRVSVAMGGVSGKPALITLHDLGLNANSSFQSFFQYSDMAEVMERFAVYHITLPGQEDEAEPWPAASSYPSLDDLTAVVENVRTHFNLKSFVGMGVGVGANILLRYAVKNEALVDGLVLLNTLAQSCGWIEWGYQKANIRHLRQRGMTTLTQDYLMWHHFGRNLDRYSPDMILSYKQYFARLPNPPNLAAFIESIVGRTPLPLAKGSDGSSNVACPVLQIVGGGSPFVNDTVEVNAKLDPSRSDWMKLAESSGLVLEEQPDKVTEAILLFLQGIGYYPSFSHCQWVEKRKAAAQHSSAAAASLSPKPAIQEPQELKV